MSNATAVREFNVQQRAVADALDGAFVVDAGAGVGKTASITERTRRLIEGGVRPSEILLMTFTVKAAEEMGARVEKATGGRLTWAMNFHRLCMRLLRSFPEFGIPKPDVLTKDDQKRILKRLAKEQGLESTEPKFFDKVLKQVKQQREHRMGYTAHARTLDANNFPIIQTLAKGYEDYIEQEGKVDFDRMIFHVVTMLRRDKDLAAKVQGIWRYAIIDEFQDTSHAQFELVTLLIPPQGGAHKNIMCVGDMDQCIFGFAGAQVTNMQRFIDTYKAKVLPLEMNYRSRAEILDVANVVIAENAERLQKTLRPTLGGGGLVELIEAFDTGKEARWVADSVREAMRQGHKPQDIAVLFRTSALSREIESALSPLRVPYKVVGGLKFWERREVQDTVALAKLLAGRQDVQAWERVTMAVPMGMGEKAWEGVNQALAEEVLGIEAAIDRKGSTKARFFLNHLRTAREIASGARAKAASGPASGDPHAGLAAVEALKHLIGMCSLREAIQQQAKNPEEARDRMGNVMETINSLAEALTAGKSLDIWLDDVGVGADKSKEDDHKPSITLSTIHAAKGLEWKKVYLIGLTDDILPIAYAATAREIEEERRLMYVAVTRAKDHLVMSYPKVRLDQGGRKNAIKSRFLGKLTVRKKVI